MTDLKEHQDAAALLAAGAALGEAKKNPLADGLPYALVPQGYDLHLLDQQLTRPHRKSGTVKLHDEASFVAYFQRHQADSVIYGSLRPAQFVAVFNDHTTKEPGFRDHRAVFVCAHSDEWSAWHGKHKQKMTQIEFALFVEDNLPDFESPAGAAMLEMAVNFRVAERVSFDKAVRLTDGHAEFTYYRLMEGSAGRGDAGKIKIPEQFTLRIPVFSGLEATTYPIQARLRYRLQEGQLSIWYELIRPQKVLEIAFKDIWQRIEQATGIKILYGSPE